MQQQSQPHSLQVTLHFDDMGLHNLRQLFEQAALYIMLFRFADVPMSLCPRVSPPKLQFDWHDSYAIGGHAYCCQGDF